MAGFFFHHLESKDAWTRPNEQQFHENLQNVK